LECDPKLFKFTGNSRSTRLSEPDPGDSNLGTLLHALLDGRGDNIVAKFNLSIAGVIEIQRTNNEATTSESTKETMFSATSSHQLITETTAEIITPASTSTVELEPTTESLRTTQITVAPITTESPGMF
jgi:hypothetical protein